MDAVAMGFEAVGAAVLVAGAGWAGVRGWRTWRAESPAAGLLVLRRAFGTTLLLGLEVLVAADLIRTVAVAPTLENVAVLGLIVVIRTFLSFSLQVEIEGVMPWRRARLDAERVAAPATPEAAAVIPPPAAADAEGAEDVPPPGFVGRHEGPG
jgi:uncharacterized membrane protein